MVHNGYNSDSPSRIAEYFERNPEKRRVGYDATPEGDFFWGKLRPSIHMPRSFSRILVEITSIKVERLQEISEEDAQAEGCVNNVRLAANSLDYTGHYARDRFITLWDSINGKNEAHSWQANPWVWVVEFKRLEVK